MDLTYDELKHLQRLVRRDILQEPGNSPEWKFDLYEKLAREEVKRRDGQEAQH